jgi:glycosyltransferase involved in cell wall biosynthesis
MSMSNHRLRVLLVPDSVYWVTGTIAKSIARFNPWIEATIASGPVIDIVFKEHPELMGNFDLVHFTCPYASRAWLPRFRDLVPCVTSHHHVTDWELIKHNLDGDAIIVGSPEWAEDLSERGADMRRVFYVPYGVDAEQFKPASDAERASIRNNLGIAAHATVVGFFGKNSSNDDDRKGIDVFTKAVLELQLRAPELAVLIVGPGWKELVSSLNSCGVRCIWLPFVRDLDGLAKMYHALDFYWVTARVEGGPVTLLEAMSSEICCLTTPVGIAREVVRHGENAATLPFNDANAFVEGTLKLAGDKAERKRLGRNARQTILKGMHIGVTALRVREVYAKALANFAVRHQLNDIQLSSSEQLLAELPSDKLQVVADSKQSTHMAEREEIPLHGFPADLHWRIRMLESLFWSEHLILYHRQRAVALKMIAREWCRNPLSALPPCVLLRRFLPVSLVAKVVKFKNRSGTTVNAELAMPENVK